MYINCKTNFSFRYGTYFTEVLVKAAAINGIKTLALTNINNTCDLWDFVDFCKKHGIKPVAGTEIRNEGALLYLLLAKNNKGVAVVNEFLTHYLADKTPFPARPSLAHVYVIYPFGNIPLNTLGAEEFIGIQHTELNKLYGLSVQVYAHKLVAWHPVTFHNKTQYNVHRLLRAIDKNILLSRQERKDVAGEHEIMLSPSKLEEHFAQYPTLIANACKILNNCTVVMEGDEVKTKKVFTSSKEEDMRLLRKLAEDGVKQRYGDDNTEAKERMEKELRIINDLNFNAYFLITWDIAQYASNRGFFYVGRGSGANSLVAYCLKITDVDPIQLDLYFERFLNPHRAVPPDFDMDFSHTDRNEIISYIFKKYGAEHVCLLGSYATFQENAILRELGKVFGLPKHEIDQLVKNPVAEDKIHKQILQYAKLIKDFPNHLSIHAGGMLISEEPLNHYTAREMPPKGFATSQIDMFLAEKIHLPKLDILSQRGLGHIRETIDLVKENKDISIDIHDVAAFMKDAKIAARIKGADTIGGFYVESPGMRQLLKKLRCDDYITLVAASSIIRPGVSNSGMMKEYIYRFNNPGKFEYLHPVMEDLLKETYGVMVYQEDVIKVAHHYAGLTLADADVLRKTMSGKYRSREDFERIKAAFFAGALALERPENTSLEVWRQIESFGGFSFSKAHSASYAVESYQSLYLKTYFPMEFMVAVINNMGGFYSRELYFHELKKTGAQLHLPCVNNGYYMTSIKGTDVYMGFVHIEGLEHTLVQLLLQERKRNGAYRHLQDFVERVFPGLEQLNILIRIGALRFTGKSKKELLWEANFLQKKNSRHNTVSTLFNEKPVEFNLPVLKPLPLDDALDEMELLGFTVSNIFELVDDDIGSYIPADAIPANLGKRVTVLGYLITSKPVSTTKGPMNFHTFIDAAGNWLDVIFFPDTNKRYPLTGKGFYVMTGIVVEEFGAYSVNVSYCHKAGIRQRSQQANPLNKEILYSH